jgi:small multidrug resistance family-3 protein
VKTFVLYSVTALAEILGCYGVFLWLRQGKPVWWAVAAVVSLGIFVWLLTLHPFANAGRVYAAYGGVYIAASLLWLWLIEKQAPEKWDSIGALDRGGNDLFWAKRKRCTLKLLLWDKPPSDCQVSPRKDSLAPKGPGPQNTPNEPTTGVRDVADGFLSVRRMGWHLDLIGVAPPLARAPCESRQYRRAPRSLQLEGC